MNGLSGKFVVRLPPKLHASLKRLAVEKGVSLNGLCLSALESCVGSSNQATRVEGPVPIEQVRSLLGELLLGVLLFGSAARGEQRSGSDVDLMIVVSDDLPLTRSLYTRWDQGIEGAATSPVSPHFVHLAADEKVAGSLWYEAAVDGVILHDRDGRVGRLLRLLRRAMADGKLQRKSAHGHPYWIRRDREVARVQ